MKTDLTQKEQDDKTELEYRIVEMNFLIQSGYAGINNEGYVVDRRVNHNAIPLQANIVLRTPTPKEL